MNIRNFKIGISLERLRQYSNKLTNAEYVYTATIISIFQYLNQLIEGKPVHILIDINGELFENPISYIAPCAENQEREFLRIYPRSLFQNVNKLRKSWFKIVRKESEVIYSPDNLHLNTVDILFLLSVHELRHKLQNSCKIFTPKSVEENRAFLGVTLDVHKIHLREHPEHYTQSGNDALEREFDAEVIAMYAANLWRSKTPQEVRNILLSEPTK